MLWWKPHGNILSLPWDMNVEMATYESLLELFRIFLVLNPVLCAVTCQIQVVHTYTICGIKVNTKSIKFFFCKFCWRNWKSENQRWRPQKPEVHVSHVVDLTPTKFQMQIPRFRGRAFKRCHYEQCPTWAIQRKLKFEIQDGGHLNRKYLYLSLQTR